MPVKGKSGRCKDLLAKLGGEKRELVQTSYIKKKEGREVRSKGGRFLTSTGRIVGTTKQIRAKKASRLKKEGGLRKKKKRGSSSAVGRRKKDFFTR